jgi:hypothetical protein
MPRQEPNPLKKWVLSNRFFIKTTDPKEKKASASHFLLDGGIWNIPTEKYSEFLNLLAIDLQNGEKHYICENKTPIFKLICDIDMFEDTIITTEQIKSVVNVIQSVVSEYYGPQKVIICGADSKNVKKMVSETGGFGQKEIELVKSGFHLIWPDIWCTVDTAKRLRILFIERLIGRFSERDHYNTWDDVVDLSVYEDNGLRMVGCRKMGICKSCKNKKEFKDGCLSCQGCGRQDENRVYSPKAVLGPCESSYFGSICNYSVMVYETSIYNYTGLPETPQIKPINIQLEEPKRKRVKDKDTDETTVKVENFIRKNFKETHSRIKIVKMTRNENCYYAEPDDNFCINVNRNHSSSGVYFQITNSGISQRCYCRKETLENRSSGMCRNFASPEVPLTKVLQTLLFSTPRVRNKQIVNMTITKSQVVASLDLSVSKHQNYTKGITADKEICLLNCRNMLFQLESEILKNKK